MAKKAGSDPFLDQELDVNDDDVIDLSEVPEAAGFELWPRGVYDAVVEDIEFGRSQRSNNPMLTWHLKVQRGGEEGGDRNFWYFTTLDPKGLPRVRRAIARVDPEFDLSTFKPGEVGEQLAGKPCQVRIRVQTYEGERRNSVADLLAPRDNVDAFLQG